ncbi:MAG: G1 family glutamic endopeptidase [Bryobacteraceae bacterium]
MQNFQRHPDGSATTANWSGYVVTGDPGTVTAVKGSWIVPAVSCNSSAAARSSFWVGIDGAQGVATLAQIGTESSCAPIPKICAQAPCYFAWFEFLPDPQVDIKGLEIHPGDTITADVTWTGSKFVVSISDVSTEDSDKADSPEGYTSLLAQAEWIAEAPSLNNITQPLADFGTISFGGDYTGLPDTCYATIGGQTQPVGAFPANTVIPTTLVQSFSPRVVTESIPSKLSQDSSSFTVTTSTLTTMAVLDQTTGTQPIAGLIQGSDGNFYGVTSAGGAQNGGTLFEVTSSGTFTTLYNFSNGSAPLASLMQATGGNFYGTTSEGGLGDGTIFSFAPGGTPTNLWAFCEDENCAGGGYPNSGLTQAADGSLYGTTSSFAQGDEGTAYQLTPSGVLAKPTPYTFCQLPDCHDGAFPSGLVQGADGNFYGTARTGGEYQYGTVFQLIPTAPTWTLNTLWSFCKHGQPCADGELPLSSLVQGPDGAFYGTTYLGGLGAGTIFKVAPGQPLTPLHLFNDTGTYPDGSCPYAPLVLGPDGNFYGTTTIGGPTLYGEVFRITPSGVYTILYGFCALFTQACADGILPEAGLIVGSDGNLYGATTGGGSSSSGGTIFRLNVGLKPSVANSR